MRVGVISDTHGYLNPHVLRLFAGVERILHAGDIGDAAVVRRLEELAPVTAVRGNNDRDGATSAYPLTQTVEVQGKWVLLTHQITVPRGPGDPIMEVYHHRGIDVVVFGHSHMARQELCRGVLFFNPGSAGKPRFRSVPSVGILAFEDGGVTGTVKELARAPAVR